MSDFVRRQVVVDHIVSSRYEDNVRPASWGDRLSGYDKIRTTDGESILLLSDGQQSPPQAGWTLLLLEEEASPEELDHREQQAFKWTLYGIKEVAA